MQQVYVAPSEIKPMGFILEKKSKSCDPYFP